MTGGPFVVPEGEQINRTATGIARDIGVPRSHALDTSPNHIAGRAASRVRRTAGRAIDADERRRTARDFDQTAGQPGDPNRPRCSPGRSNRRTGRARNPNRA